MKRRSRAGGKPVKTRPGKTVSPKPRKALRRRSASWATGQEVARLTRELHEALEQQAATSEVLKVISNSPSGLEPVFQAMLKNATRLCGAKFGNLWLREGDLFRSGPQTAHRPPMSIFCATSRCFAPIQGDCLAKSSGPRKPSKSLISPLRRRIQKGYATLLSNWLARGRYSAFPCSRTTRWSVGSASFGKKSGHLPTGRLSWLRILPPKLS